MGRHAAAPKTAADVASEADALEIEIKRLRKAKADLRRLEAEAATEPDELIDEDPGRPGAALIEKVLSTLEGGEGSFTIKRVSGGKVESIGQYDLELWPTAY